MKKLIVTIIILALVFSLSACRMRTTQETLDLPETQPSDSLSEQDAAPNDEKSEATDAPTSQDENSERREFAPDASGELTPDADTPLQTPENGSSAATSGESGNPANVETSDADKTATETVPADEADKTGTDPNAPVADTVLNYYVTLLDSRVGDLFECKRLYIYWETIENYGTISSEDIEHQLILGAGAYDVSSRLLAENLTVDAGWVTRKNPDLIIKIMSGGALNQSDAQAVIADMAARTGWNEITAVKDKRVIVLSEKLLDTPAGQVAAMVYMAKMMYPDQLQDVDPDEALKALTQENEGAAYEGSYAVWM